jgi:uncharacterized membrane protein YeaQ/YmgE (transglycosylase-associated protein family)
MMEAIVQMGPMLVLGGLMVGWGAEVVSRVGGYGFISDLVIGLGGSLLVGAIFWAVVSSNVGMVAMLAIGCVGGAAAIAAQRQLVRSAPPAL